MPSSYAIYHTFSINKNWYKKTRVLGVNLSEYPSWQTRFALIITGLIETNFYKQYNIKLLDYCQHFRVYF